MNMDIRSASDTRLHKRKRRTRAETRLAVLNTAGRLFFTQGVEQTSLRAITRDTGLSKRGVILHFSSKADILATRFWTVTAQEHRGL